MKLFYSILLLFFAFNLANAQDLADFSEKDLTEKLKECSKEKESLLKEIKNLEKKFYKKQANLLKQSKQTVKIDLTTDLDFLLNTFRDKKISLIASIAREDSLIKVYKSKEYKEKNKELLSQIESKKKKLSPITDSIKILNNEILDLEKKNKENLKQNSILTAKNKTQQDTLTKLKQDKKNLKEKKANLTIKTDEIKKCVKRKEELSNSKQTNNTNLEKLKALFLKSITADVNNLTNSTDYNLERSSSLKKQCSNFKSQFLNNDQTNTNKIQDLESKLFNFEKIINAIAKSEQVLNSIYKAASAKEAIRLITGAKKTATNTNHKKELNKLEPLVRNYCTKNNEAFEVLKSAKELHDLGYAEGFLAENRVKFTNYQFLLRELDKMKKASYQFKVRKGTCN